MLQLKVEARGAGVLRFTGVPREKSNPVML